MILNIDDIKQLGYHIDTHGDCAIDIYKHGNFIASCYRYDRRAEWRYRMTTKLVLKTDFNQEEIENDDTSK